MAPSVITFNRFHHHHSHHADATAAIDTSCFVDIATIFAFATGECTTTTTTTTTASIASRHLQSEPVNSSRSFSTFAD